MKQILLTSPAYLNGGAYASVGTTVIVGTDKLEITEERAADLVKSLRADPDGAETSAPKAAGRKA